MSPKLRSVASTTTVLKDEMLLDRWVTANAERSNRKFVSSSMSLVSSEPLALRALMDEGVAAILKRHQHLLKLARALMTFGAPSHRIESQLLAAARILEINAEFIHLPSVIMCCFGDNDTTTSETHFVKCSGGLALGNLHGVHLVYRAVSHDGISARKATQQSEELLSAPPLYSIWFRCSLSFFLSVLICPLAFGGSFLDTWIAGAGAFFLCYLQLNVATKSAMYSNVFECVVLHLLLKHVLKAFG